MPDEKIVNDPQKILNRARSCARKLRFYDGLHWYRTYLCLCSDDGEVRSEMQKLQQTETAFAEAKKTAQWIGEACETFTLQDSRVHKSLTRLTRLIAVGPAEKAIEVAAKLPAQFETAARLAWSMGDDSEFWESVAWLAAEEESYELALRFAEMAKMAPRMLTLYQSLCEAELHLSWVLLEESSLQQLERTDALRRAMKRQDLLEIRRCLAQLYEGNEGNGGDSPGLGVPARPRPPRLPASEKRNFPHSPPPL